MKIIFLFLLILFNFSTSYGLNTSTPLMLKALPEIYNQPEIDVLDQAKAQEQETDLTNFSHGVMSYERREFALAKAYLVASLAQVELAPYTYYYLGKVAVELKNYNAAYAAFEEALKFSPQHNLQRNINLEMAKVMFIKGKWPQSRRLFLASRRKFKRTEQYPEILWNLFLIDFKQNSKSQCFWFKSLFESYPNFEVAKTWTLDESTWTYENKAIKCNLNFITKYRHISQLIALGDYQAVESALEIAKTSMPRMDYLELLANYELRAGNPVRAFEALNQDFEKQSENIKFLQLYIKVSSRSLNHDRALTSYDKIISLEKNPRIKAGLIFRKGFLQYELSNYEDSYNTMMTVQKTFASHPYQGDVLWYLGWTAYLQKKYDLALTHFEEIYSYAKRNKYIRSRDNYSKERIGYWMAQSYRGLNNFDKAAELFQEVIAGERLDYYSFLASAYLQEVLPKGKKSKVNERLLSSLSVPWLQESLRTNASSESTKNYVLRNDFNPDTDSYLTQQQEKELSEVFSHDKYQTNLKRFKFLIKLGFYEDAKWELYSLERKSKSKVQKKQLVKLYRQIDDLPRASRIMTLSFERERQNKVTEDGGDDPFELWAQTYPRPHQEFVTDSSDKFKVPQNLVYSIMRAESFYSKTAMSGVGARGLLQLMPFTASQVSGLLGQEEGIRPEQLFEPGTNIQLGVRYLNRLLKTFSGDKILAIAAYNAGPHRAEWWVSQFGTLRQDEFIEHILFMETRKYVKKVLKFNWIYDLLYDNQVSFAEIKSPLEFQLTGQPSLTEKWDQ